MERIEWTRRLALWGLVVVGVGSVMAALPQMVWADEAAEKQGAALMDKYVEVTGGKAAYEAVKTRIVKAEAIMPGGGMTGKMEVYAAYPDKFRVSVEMPGGSFERGSDGKTVWVSHPAFGTHILRGANRVSAIRQSTQDRFGRWRSTYLKAEYAGDEDVNGAKCSKVVLTLKPLDPAVKESPVTVFIAQDSGLVVKWTSEMVTAEGTVEVITTAGDYKKTGGIITPHTIKITTQDLEQAVKVQEIVFNADIPADKFALPEAVKEQLRKENEETKKGR